ncbi:sodium/solute symporter [Pseudoalteromonas sp. MMG005]|uniref:sodium:solute symporter family transporter n=1 Tax=Pseudoalteromonas sp. MMG005 TaxID=2822682 RepID=UPI001B39E5CE|nr:sodium/solute symporter [Pseudoalteromonas sp. MMG005]MBQ4846681.1 sodium/solute symporter [Pseudoalteromonas sp. MMG005]
MTLSQLDITVLIFYAVLLLTVALYISKSDKSAASNTEDYFLASKALPWWAIGASLIASNISAEQIIGMSGSGYAMGLAIASYEWMAAITLILVGKYLLPIFLKQQIYTMPQYLEQRYNKPVKVTLALFWLVVYIFVNLTAVLWLAGMAIESISGLDAMIGMLLLCLFSVAYSTYGGLKAVAYTDIIQVVLLVLGGLLLSYLALNQVSAGKGIIVGFTKLSEQLPSHFDMILSPENSHYASLPGVSVLVGGLWIMNISYWGFNQYIIQRALAAKDLNEAQKGIAFAAYLKLLMPFIVVLPGITAVILYPKLPSPDLAYPAMMGLMPSGIKGLIFAALVAAIVSSLASMTNSISTIFTMDLYKEIKPHKSQHHYVVIGRVAAVFSLTIALVVAKPLLGQFEQAFQYVQEFTGIFTPGIVVIFLLGMFWPRANSQGALAAAIGSALYSIALAYYFPNFPFMDRIGLVFLMCLLTAIITSNTTTGHRTANRSCHLPTSASVSTGVTSELFNTSQAFNIAGLGCVIILAALYVTWW